MVEKKEKELAAKEKSEVAEPLRRSGDQGIPAGFDDVDKEDLRMPRLAILQGLSEMVTNGDAKMGELANSLTKEIYGNEVEFIPLFMFKSRAQFEMGKGLVMYSRDNITVTMAKDELAQYVNLPVEEVPGSAWTGDLPPKFNLVYNFPVMLIGKLTEFPVSLSLMKTGAKVAKDLISMARFSNEDMFARVYNLKTRVEKNDKGTFAMPAIEFKRRCTNEEYAIAKKFFDDLYRRKSKIDVDLEQEHSAESQEQQ